MISRTIPTKPTKFAIPNPARFINIAGKCIQTANQTNPNPNGNYEGEKRQ